MVFSEIQHKFCVAPSHTTNPHPLPSACLWLPSSPSFARHLLVPMLSPSSHLLLPFPDPSIHPSACWHCHLRVLIPTGPQQGTGWVQKPPGDPHPAADITWALQAAGLLLRSLPSDWHEVKISYSKICKSKKKKERKKCKSAAWNQPASSLLLLVNHFFLFPLFFCLFVFIVCCCFFSPSSASLKIYLGIFWLQASQSKLPPIPKLLFMTQELNSVANPKEQLI